MHKITKEECTIVKKFEKEKPYLTCCKLDGQNRMES